MSLPSGEQLVLRGSVALLPFDPLAMRPADVPCVVTALPPRGAAVPAVAHTTGLYGFSRLSPGVYRFLLRPAGGGLLPSLRTLTLPRQPAEGGIVIAALRPGPTYPVPRGAITLRGTLLWRRPTLTPARFAAVFCVLGADKNGATRTVHRTWTRSDANGDFSLVLLAEPPSGEGTRDPLRATVTIHAGPPTGASGDDLSDLPSDDGSEDELRARQPAARAPLVVTGLAPGQTLSLNRDDFTTVPPGATQPQPQRVILLG